MPRFGFGSRRERQEAQQALRAFGIHSPQDAVLAIRQKRINGDALDHVVTAFGQHPDVKEMLAQRVNGKTS